MSKLREIDSATALAETLGLDADTIQSDPGATLILDGDHKMEARRDALHTLPELRLEGECGDLKPDFSMVRTLGQGGMGLVRLANQLSLDREVAVKTTRSGTGESAARSLLQEAYVTGYLEHPNIIPIYNVGRTSDGAPLIVMKRVEGDSWLEKLEAEAGGDSAMDLASHIEILIQVCNALRFAHSHGIIHRDIKPENVMIGDFDEVYLLDWGIAISLHDDKPLLPRRSQLRGMAGTPIYMAPEMALQKVDELDEQTDIYLLGATLHHVLTGRERHDGESMLEVLYAASLSEPFEYGDDVPDELAAIANRACHREKEERFASVEAFRDALQDYLKHRESVALSESADRKRLELMAHLEQPDPDLLVIHDTYGECRFGFYQALRMWPDNDLATRGLQKCLEAMADHYLRQGSLDSARACIAELPDERPELVERADELARRLDEEQEDLQRLKKLERNLSLRTASGTRSIMMVAFGVLWTITSLYAAIRLDFGDVTPAQDLQNHMVSGIRNIGIVALAIFFFRKRLFANQANRRLVYLLVAMISTVAMMRISAWYLGESIILARTADSLIYVLALIAVGMVADLRICLFAVYFLLAAVIGILWPETQVYGNTIATAATFFSFAWIWRPQGRKAPGDNR